MFTYRRRDFRGFTLIELMIVVAIIGLLAVVAIPQFQRQMRKAKTAEATINLKHMYDGLTAYYASELADQNGNTLPRAFPTPQVATPSVNACCTQTGQKCAPNQAAWQTPTWQALNFKMDSPHYFWYLTAQSADGTKVGDKYDLRAQANLNCDTKHSLFQISATVDQGFSLQRGGGLYVVDETE